MRTNLFLGVAAVALVIPAAASAQDTTAVIRGTVTQDGNPVAGADVVAVNVPSGTRSTTRTDSDGSFNLPGLRVGGPYTVQVNSGGIETSVTDIYTVIGQAYTVPVDLPASNDIVVTAASLSGAGTTSDGPQTVLGRTEISRVASVNRDVRDLERRDPFATLDLANSRAVTFAGVNSRFNRFSVDGVSVEDTFGLNSDASPTRRGPVPLDAISQFSISIAPYDIRQGNFQGGAIDLVLLSGTNNFHGTGFYSQYRDELLGDKIGSFRYNAPNFKSETYGATLSGPIIQDKLFFMVSAERNIDPRPQTPSVASDVQGLTAATVGQIQQIAQNKFNYNAGGIVGISPNKDEKIVGKIDWNISDNQKLSLTYINSYDSNVNIQNTTLSGSRPGLGLSSNAYESTELLRSGVAQLNSDWTDNFSTEARFGYTSRSAGQNPLNGLGFAQFQVCTDAASTGSTTSCSTGIPSVTFGPDSFRQANTFFTDRYKGSLLARLNMNNHDLKIYGEFNETRTSNLFVANAAGSYYFDSIADFQAGNANSVSYQGAVSGNINKAAADFVYQQYTFGVGDDWNISDQLSVSYGIRYDLFGQSDTPPVNNNFIARYGFPNTRTFKGLGLPQPRVSFNWKPTPVVTIRGGAGIFGGGTPDVYLGNSFSRTGIQTNNVFVQRNANGTFRGATDAVGAAALNNVNGAMVNPALVDYTATNTGSLSLAETDAFDPSFNIPSLVKATLSGDLRPNFLGGGWTFGADFYYSKTRDAVQFTDIRSVPIGTLPDGRTRYGPLVPGDNSGNADILLTNGTQGRSYIGVVRFDKKFDFGLYFGGSYTLADVRDISPATSSQATSNYRNAAFLDPNFSAYGTSNDQTRWAFKYNAGFAHAFFGDYKTTVSLFGETHAGKPYSFTMRDNDSNGARSAVFGTLYNNYRYLLYVPTSGNDPIVTYDSPATQTALENLIGNSVLKKYRGQIAPRNIARSRVFTRIDLHLEQELPTFIGGSRVSVFADIENLPNLLNSKWGGLRQARFPYTLDVVKVQCLSAAGTVATSSAQPCATYQYSQYQAPDDSRLDSDLTNSLYSIRIGARFSF